MPDEIKEPSATEYWEKVNRRKAGRPRLGDKKLVHKTFRSSPWLFKAVQWVQDQEQARTGKRPGEGRTYGLLMQMGVDTYRRVMRLPEIKR